MGAVTSDRSSGPRHRCFIERGRDGDVPPAGRLHDRPRRRGRHNFTACEGTVITFTILGTHADLVTRLTLTVLGASVCVPPWRDRRSATTEGVATGARPHYAPALSVHCRRQRDEEDGRIGSPRIAWSWSSDDAGVDEAV